MKTLRNFPKETPHCTADHEDYDEHEEDSDDVNHEGNGTESGGDTLLYFKSFL